MVSTKWGIDMYFLLGMFGTAVTIFVCNKTGISQKFGFASLVFGVTIGVIIGGVM